MKQIKFNFPILWVWISVVTDRSERLNMQLVSHRSKQHLTLDDVMQFFQLKKQVMTTRKRRSILSVILLLVSLDQDIEEDKLPHLVLILVSRRL